MAVLIPAWIDGDLRPVEKLSAHLGGLRHKAVSVFVMAGNEMLIQQRALGKYHTPGLWANTCCTHPEWGESDAACAIRRLSEELGITGISPRLQGQVEYRAAVGGGMTEHEVVAIFAAHLPDRCPVVPAPEEVMATRWITLENLQEEVNQAPETFTPWFRIYLARHRDMILGAP